MNESALGFHIVGGIDFYFSEKVAIGLDVKWFRVEPEFDIDGNKEKVNYGGIIYNAGLKIRF